MSMARPSHPFFARFYAWMSPHADRTLSIAQHRDELLAGLRGRVIEIGAGNGLNFAHYPAEVEQVVAIEPEPYLRAKAIRAAARAAVPVAVRPGRAESLGEPDASFDAAVFSLVLCSVAEPARALAEARRVLRPGGELRFYEHVRAADGRRARAQDRVTPVWSFFGGGCHPNRDTVRAIEEAGFTEVLVRRFELDLGVFGRPVRPHVLGRARR